MWTYDELKEIERSAVLLPAMTDEQLEAAMIRKDNEKELKRLRVKYDRLLDKRDKMLFCAGVKDATISEWKRGMNRELLKKRKTWIGNEYEIEQTKRNIEYLEYELKGE